jgi:hypothetical protein
LVGALVALLSACGAAPPRPAHAPTGVLIVRCDVGDAALWIDDQPVGEVGQLGGGVRVPAGARRVELRHDGYHTRYADVVVPEGQRTTVELTLPEAFP